LLILWSTCAIYETHSEKQQLLLEVGGRKGDGGSTGYVGRLQLGDQVVHRQRVDLLVLRKGGHRAPSELPDEGDARRIVRGIRGHRPVEVGELPSVAQRRRRGAEGDLSSKEIVRLSSHPQGRLKCKTCFLESRPPGHVSFRLAPILPTHLTHA